ncbi:TonB-dependent receptor [Leptospira fletcheri]|uniref:TonB-dependent receptor n=1 Tax=Leptospira fletcheri TaxID=2484981 RepID=A0A4R9GH95_9LEPT|nr:TonB-dependent receptor plug domain-containing protein [Leptospira fletcheri]TGK12007.1 TonB-dependent receptor [Leptospira fletcheri]
MQVHFRRFAVALAFFLPLQIAFSETEIEEKSKLPAKSDSSRQTNAKNEGITVRGKADSRSASEGRIDSQRLKARPIQNVGELAEAIPGVIVTQHSGGGKANQFFLRGFNLDHGTDFASSIDGVPINNPSHAHGQGYTDLNFIIPELVREIEYKKGVYHVEEGDFSSAGAMRMNYFKSLPKSLIKIEGGSLGFKRTVFAESKRIGSGNLLYAGEYSHYNGPWTIPDRYNKLNSFLGYSLGDASEGMSVQFSGYRGSWHATNQIPQRALKIGRSWLNADAGGLNRYDAEDPNDGGHSRRASFTAEAHKKTANSEMKALLYGTYYDLDLFSDFTFFLNDPVNGDQVEQKDRRSIGGGKASYSRTLFLGSFKSENTVGVQFRRDYIHTGLYHTQARSRLERITLDRVIESSASVYYENRISFTNKIKAFAGVRNDTFFFNVADDLTNRSTIRRAQTTNPKAGLNLGPWKGFDFYLNGGYGFHSNDAKGLLLPYTTVSPIARTGGSEVGMKTMILPGLQSSLVFWRLDLDSELVYSGDDGTTSPSRPSTRKGVEWSNLYSLSSWLTVDLDVSISKAKYRKYDPIGNYVPQAIGKVFAAGISFDRWEFFGSIRVRYFGPRALIESDWVRSAPSTLWNLQIGKHIGDSCSIQLDVFNLTNTPASQVQYYYPTLLKNEAPGPDSGGYNDILTHPVMPRNIRFSLSIKY